MKMSHRDKQQNQLGLALESAAIRAHSNGTTWEAFWRLHWREVSRAAGRSRRLHSELVERLLALVAAGDQDGQPIRNSWPRPEPWELPHTSPPHR